MRVRDLDDGELEGGVPSRRSCSGRFMSGGSVLRTDAIPKLDLQQYAKVTVVALPQLPQNTIFTNRTISSSSDKIVALQQFQRISRQPRPPEQLK